MLEYTELMALFEDERALLDAVIERTTKESWHRFLHALLNSGWPLEMDGSPVDEIEAESFLPDGPEAEVHTLKVWPSEEVQINVFPLAADSIDFDFDTAELTDQNAVDTLGAFIECAAVAAQKDVVVSHEGHNGPPLFVFEFRTRRFRFADGNSSCVL